MRTHEPLLLLATSVAAIAGPAAAQDFFAVGWPGSAYSVDSDTGTTAVIGPSQFGQNAVEYAGGQIWASARTAATPYVYSLHIIDPTTGASTTIYNNTPDIRGMAGDGSPGIWCAIESSAGDSLALLDTTTGVFTTIGPFGVSSVQGLSWHQGSLYALDITLGLLLVDPSTGAATDVAPGVGAPATANQFLLSRSDGKLVCGRQDLYEIDPVTGLSTFLSSIGGTDLRGATLYFGHARDFGSGCQTVVHTAGGSLDAGGTLDSTSSNHAANAIGALLIGLAPLPAPIDLGALFGATGCSILVSPQLNAPLQTMGTDLTITLPLGLDNGGFVLELQHVSLEAVPGGIATSNASRVFIGY